MHRPLTAAQVSENPTTLNEFGYNLKDWIHELKRISARKELWERVKQKPRRLKSLFEGGEVADAYLAAYVDHLCRLSKIPAPDWVYAPDLVLENPWFSDDVKTLRLYLMIKTPPAFKEKNIFTIPEVTFTVKIGRPKTSLAHKRALAAKRQKAFRKRQKLELESLRKKALR